MKKIINFFVLLVFIVNMTGCATILKPKETQMSISSEPEGAEIYQTTVRTFGRGKEIRVGRTPTVLTLDNLHNAELTFHKDGYEEASYVAKPHINHGWMLASFVCLMGPAFIDFVTHNTYGFREKEIKVNLDPVLPKQTDQVNAKK